MTRVTGTWLDAAHTQQVMRLLTDAGYQALAVGGCVRNALLGVPVTDIDISTDARPEVVMQLAKAAGLKAVPTGIDHGTVTVVTEHEGFEITTFRADVETDGRRAVVRYSQDVREDALRRDFTMNALYAAADGTLLDPLQGLPDLQARRVRFIEDADRRIKEDYLRILRFFRFSAWYGDPQAGFDADALAAIAENTGGLTSLSRERVGAELVKLLSAPNPAPALGVMAQCGVLTALLPGAEAIFAAPLVHLEEVHDLAPEPMRRLAVLGVVEPETLRLSKAHSRAFELKQSLISDSAGPAEVAYRHGAETAYEALILRAAILGGEVPQASEEIAKGANAVFPVKPADLMPRLQGAKLGAALKQLEVRWIASGFAAEKDELIQALD
ncbi:MAG: CCA tRNA nucleotidyltransferase [Paracoccaceae bacterium]|nr:CCA tRNA nucleotidyltransferase [Paracoccaceae bacterium]